MRLIDADALNAELESHVFSARTDGATVRNVRRIAEAIANAPTVDPVTHGKWVKYDPKKNQWEWLALCSECGNCVDEYDLINNEFPKFCANCGCRMDEKEAAE